MKVAVVGGLFILAAAVIAGLFSLFTSHTPSIVTTNNVSGSSTVQTMDQKEATYTKSIVFNGTNNGMLHQTQITITEPATLPKLYLSSNVILDNGIHELILIVANSDNFKHLALNHPEYCKFIGTFYQNLQPNPNSHGEPARHDVFYCTSPANLSDFSLPENE